MKKPAEKQHGIIDFIRDQLGEEAASKVQDAFGGVRLQITNGTRKSPSSQLIQKLGPELASKVSRVTGYVNEVVPMGDHKGYAALIRSRNQKIEDMIRAGHSCREIALLHRAHERTVWRIRARIKHEEKPDVLLMLSQGRTVADVARFTIIAEKDIVKMRCQLIEAGKLSRDGSPFKPTSNSILSVPKGR